jgi:hypothetical protein
MQTELWSHFGSLVSGPPRILATVQAHNADGTSTVATFEGTVMRVQGQLTGSLPYNAWVQDGRLTDAGPNLPLSLLTV